MKSIQVEVVVSWPPVVLRAQCECPEGSRLRDVYACLSTTLKAYWDQAAAISLWGRRVGLDTPLSQGDRIAILQRLKADPKDARRQRVERLRQNRASSGSFDRWTRSR